MIKHIIKECKKIQTNNFELFWNKYVPNHKDYNFFKIYDLKEYINAYMKTIKYRIIIYEIVKKTFEENFNIKDYILEDMSTPNYFYFYNQEKQLWICFMVNLTAKKDKKVIPCSCTKDFKKCNTCADAIK